MIAADRSFVNKYEKEEEAILNMQFHVCFSAGSRELTTGANGIIVLLVKHGIFGVVLYCQATP